MEKVDTRQHIVNFAQELIQTRGYNAFSYQDIADKLKIKKASIHHHFPAKEDLGAEVMVGSLERFEKWTKSLSAKLTPTERLELYMEHGNLWTKEVEKICLGGIVNAEWNTLPKKMKVKAEALRNARRAWVIEVLAAGQKTGEFNRIDTPEDQCFFLASALQGALQVARVIEEPKVFKIVARQVMVALKK